MLETPKMGPPMPRAGPRVSVHDDSAPDEHITADRSDKPVSCGHPTDPIASSTSSISHLEKLLPEIAERVVLFLDIRGVRNLRLTSRTMAWNSQRRFRTFFRYKTLEVIDQDLKRLVEKTRPGEAGCQLEHITLAVTVDRSPAPDPGKIQDMSAWQRGEKIGMFNDLKHRGPLFQQIVESGRLQSHLTHACSNIKRHGKKGKLSTIEIRIVAYTDLSRQRFDLINSNDELQRSVHGYLALMYYALHNALTATKLEVEKITCPDWYRGNAQEGLRGYDFQLLLLEAQGRRRVWMAQREQNIAPSIPIQYSDPDLDDGYLLFQ